MAISADWYEVKRLKKFRKSGGRWYGTRSFIATNANIISGIPGAMGVAWPDTITGYSSPTVRDFDVEYDVNGWDGIGLIDLRYVSGLPWVIESVPARPTPGQARLIIESSTRPIPFPPGAMRDAPGSHVWEITEGNIYQREITTVASVYTAFTRSSINPLFLGGLANHVNSGACSNILNAAAGELLVTHVKTSPYVLDDNIIPVVIEFEYKSGGWNSAAKKRKGVFVVKEEPIVDAESTPTGENRTWVEFLPGKMWSGGSIVDSPAASDALSFSTVDLSSINALSWW